MYNKQNKQGGFVKLIIMIVIVLIVLGILGYNIEDVLAIPAVSDNLAFAWEWSVNVWDNYLAGPVVYVWNNFVKTVLEFMWDAIAGIIEGGSGGELDVAENMPEFDL